MYNIYQIFLFWKKFFSMYAKIAGVSKSYKKIDPANIIKIACDAKPTGRNLEYIWNFLLRLVS